MKKIINTFTIVMLPLFFLSLISCVNNKLVNSIHQPSVIPTKNKIELNEINNGDLIFVGTTNKNLSGAINRVTQISEERNYDHVGLIEKTTDSIFVLHAAPKGGSQRENLLQFYKNQKNELNKIVIYRLINTNQETINNAIIEAKLMLNKPYNWTYILNDESYYCSDFIERAFRNDSVFEFIPMNFKNPTTGEIDNFWIDFYSKQNLKVPQNQPGTNPNQLAESDKLIEIGPLFIETN
jgi:hypothetical protein